MEPQEIFVWVGEDERGPGSVGIKQAFARCGLIPLVAIDAEKITRAYLLAQLRAQANLSGKPLRLARFVIAEDVMTITPGKR